MMMKVKQGTRNEWYNDLTWGRVTSFIRTAATSSMIKSIRP